MSSNSIDGRFGTQPRIIEENAPRGPGEEPGGVGRIGSHEVQRKSQPNPPLKPEPRPLLRSEESWVGRVTVVGGREMHQLRNEHAPGFAKVTTEGGPGVYVRAIDKPIERMVDRDGLIRMIGRPPKPDRKFLGFIRIEGSPRYARALRRIDAFQRAMQEPVPSDPGARRAKVQQLHGMLKEARSALIAYSKHHPQNVSLKATVNAVIDRMGEEIGLLSSIKNPDSQAFLERHRVGDRPFTWASAASLMAGAGEAAMLSYDDTRLDPERSRDGLGSGINGTVDLVAYDDGSEWIFKPDRLVNPMTGGTAQKMGIDLGNPRQGDRIIATAMVDDLLSPPPREGDPEPELRATRRAIHNGQVGVLVPVARGFSPIESRPGPIVTDPGQQVAYDGFDDLDLQQMKVRRLHDVDVALSVLVEPDRLPEDVDELGDETLGARYGLSRVTVFRDQEGRELAPDEFERQGIDPNDTDALAARGIEKSLGYRTEARPLTDERSRELAQRFGAPVEHWDTAYQRTVGHTYRVDTHDPDLRRLLNIQECKDFVTGNHDRHPGNYKLEMGEDGRLARLNAYDDDETFPEEFDPRVPREGYIRHGDDGRILRDHDGEPIRERAGHEVGLPVVMDREFAQHLLTLSWDDFRALDGTVPDKALNVAKVRFELLQEHARTLEAEGRLLDRDANGVNQWEDGNWQSREGEDLHTLLSDPGTSYMGKLIDATRFGTVDMPGLAPRNEE
jgi:hypothetical protein